MGRKLDLSGLSDLEAAHVLQVVQRDMKLRKREEERLCELKQELAEEASRSHLLSRQSCFNQRCCIRCCSPFTFLLNPKRQCEDCGFNVCRSCRQYSKTTKAWVCSSCQKHRLLKTQSQEWFYDNVKRRFKRFGSAKVLKTLYKKHLTEHSILSELTDGSGYEESICNDGSICGSDSTFYRQSEEHSMSETLTVARRVAEEAIDEAITKAEVQTYSQKKQNEAHYLRLHRGELIEELATTIVEKIISRRKTLAQIKNEYDQDLTHAYFNHIVPPHHQGLWRSHSLSLLDTDSHSVKSPLQSLKEEGAGASLSAWKSVDRLDNSVFKSPDGNWIVLQSGQLSRPSLLTKRKSQVYSALEKESGAMSAYEAMDSDCEPDSSWGAALKQIHKKLSQSDLLVLEDLDLDYVGGRRGSRDSEGNYLKSGRALINKVPLELRKPSSSRRTSVVDVNYNVTTEGGTDEEEKRKQPEERRVRRSRRKRRSRKDTSALCGQDERNKDTLPLSSEAETPETLTSGALTPDLIDDLTAPGANQINHELTNQLQQLMGQASISDSSTNMHNNSGDYMDLDEGQAEEPTEQLDDDTKDRLYKLVAQSRLIYLSSTDDDLDKAGVSEDEDPQAGQDLKFKLCHLEQQVNSTQFSSTEDELDRKGLETEGEPEEIAVKVCKLVSQVSDEQFSSTEDELDRVGSAEEATDDSVLWTLPAERGEQLRNLTSFVSQFSSTEEELDQAGQYDLTQKEVTCIGFEKRESIGDLDVDMFELGEDCRAINYLEMSKSEDVEAGHTAESTDCDRRESLGDFDVSMFELKSAEKTTLEKYTQQETSVEVNFMVYKASTSIDGEIVSEEGFQKSEHVNNIVTEEATDKYYDSEEEEAEFNRIINSMLMMTLEDMQVGEINQQQFKQSGSENSVCARISEDELKKETNMKMERQVCNDGNVSSQMDLDLGANGEDRLREMQQITEGKVVHEETNADAGVELEKEEKTNQEKKDISKSLEDSLSPEEVLKGCEFELILLKQRHSAQSLCSITTEVLKVLNATEQLLRDTEGEGEGAHDPVPSSPAPQNHRQLDQQLCRLEENVYVAAGSVFGLEAQLEELEECARAVSSSTSPAELNFLEEQVATAAAQVQQSDLKISDISARIAALRNAGLNVDPQPTLTKTRTSPAKINSLDLSRQQRRLLPAPPTKDAKQT